MDFLCDDAYKVLDKQRSRNHLCKFETVFVFFVRTRTKVRDERKTKNVSFKFEIVWIFFATTRTKVREEQKNSKYPNFGGLKWTRTTDLTLIRRAL